MNVSGLSRLGFVVGVSGQCRDSRRSVPSTCRPRSAVLVRCEEFPKTQFELSLVPSISEVKSDEWDSLVGDEQSPFLEHEWLRCMEESSCAGAQAGWYPNHILIRRDGDLIGAAPCYIKTNSMGEFVFDQMWADAAYGGGIRYYPKMLCGIPFTPATGRRLLTHPDESRTEILGVLAQALRNVTMKSKGVSSMHVNFCEQDEVEALTEAGFLHRKGIQYHFVNEGESGPLYSDFTDYLGSMKSKRRIKVKRERRSIYEDAGLTMKVMIGDEIPDDMFPTMYRIYRSTVDKFFYGILHLNEKFFLMLKEKYKKNLCFIVAMRGDEVIAGTFNVIKAGRFYGRYWGAFDDNVKNLHFETCYYKPIEVCVDNGFRRMEPGAGGDEFKFLRGFDPAVTNSMHLCKDFSLQGAIARYLNSERSNIDDVVQELSEKSVLRMKESWAVTPPDSEGQVTE